MEHYADKLQREINEMQEAHPGLKQLMHELKSIDNRPQSDFDYAIERDALRYQAVTKFLKLLKHGVSGKRPDCPYCMEPISKINLEMWQSWLDECKAACASGAVDTVAEALANTCIRCKKEVGNDCFTICDDCWDLVRKSSEEQP